MRGKKGSSPKIIVECKVCGKSFETVPKQPRKSCSDDCLATLRTQIFLGEKNPAFGKTYRTKENNPEWAAAISSGLIRNGVNVGDKNGMKKPENRVIARESANRKWATKPWLKENLRSKFQAKWAAGDYDGIRVGQCKWHELKLRDGSCIRVQGSWEYAYAKWMDENGICFQAHTGKLHFVDHDGVDHSYLPDFVLDDGTFVDVKNPYYELLHAEKLDLVRQQNDVKILVVGKLKMDELGLLIGPQPRREYLPPEMIDE